MVGAALATAASMDDQNDLSTPSLQDEHSTTSTQNEHVTTQELEVPMDDVLEEHAAFPKLVLPLVPPDVTPTVHSPKRRGTH